jgi:hypothetical protein
MLMIFVDVFANEHLHSSTKTLNTVELAARNSKAHLGSDGPPLLASAVLLVLRSLVVVCGCCSSVSVCFTRSQCRDRFCCCHHRCNHDTPPRCRILFYALGVLV